MYAQVEKPKKKKSKAVANSITQKRSAVKHGIGFVDNRPKFVAQKKMQELANHHLVQHPFQKKEIYTGLVLSEGFKTVIGNLSGYSMDYKKWGYDSSPQAQLNTPPIQKTATKPKKKAPAKAKKKAHTKAGKAPKKQKMTVRNKKDSYTSGVIKSLFRSTGVNDGPRKEAQKVAKFLGGTWVGGHMINDQLGGLGDFTNIVPITSSMNARHKTIENQANHSLSKKDGTSIEYKMNIKQRNTVTIGGNTVQELPIKFQQTLDVYRSGNPKKTVIKGPVLVSSFP